MLQQFIFECKTIFLKKTVAMTVFLVPLALVGLAYATQPQDEASWVSLAASWGVLVVAFSVLFAIPTVVADRRSRLLYKRLLTSALSKSQIIIAGMAPYFFIGIFQVVFVIICLSFLVDLKIVNPALMFFGAVLLALVACVAGLALGALSQEAEKAQWVVLPVVVVVAVAANFLPMQTLDGWLRTVLYLAPGGGFVDLFYVSLGETSFGHSILGVAPTVGVVVSIVSSAIWGIISGWVAMSRFRWDIR